MIMSKIGRNEPCPCGSGKKYKHCCMRTDESDPMAAMLSRAFLPPSGLKAPKTQAYLSSHDSSKLMEYLMALQLNPQNHGKNLRLEHLSQLVVASLDKSKEKVDLEEFHSLIDEEFAVDYMEDIPMNMFCETVVFHGGNYVFFPGLSTHCEELYRAMTEAIYSHDEVFPEAFSVDVYKGVTLCLELGTMVAHRAGIKGIVKGNENQRDKIVKPDANLSFGIPESVMAEILLRNRIDAKTLQMFVLDKDDPRLLTENSDENPLLFKPVVKHNDSYYFIGISNQGCAINNFILKSAIKHHCLNELVRLTQLGLWKRIESSCVRYFHWDPLSYFDTASSDAHYSEELFQIDTNWLVYLCYVKDTEADVSVDGAPGEVLWDADTHLNTTLSVLRQDEKWKGFHILTLVLYSSMGESFALLVKEPPDSDYLLDFSAFDFLQLAQTEKWDSLSLVRYARCKERKPYLKKGFNQPLDCYSLYKQKGECFYVTDEALPDFLQIEPNDGCRLIKESKEKLDYHGTLMHTNGLYAFIPVHRDMEYASVYHPLHGSILAKSSESFNQPIWVRCNQEIQKESHLSIVDTIITAVAFWLEKLAPSIGHLIDALYDKPIDIELWFSDDALTVNELQQQEASENALGVASVTRTDTGVSVFLDKSSLRAFMGPDNGAERNMMKEIITVLLDMDKEESQAIIDERIPLGSAKMVLMTEASNNPLTYPLWLTSPIYIHQGTKQLLLDLIPQWMKEKGHDINSTLESKEDKDKFLHLVVDVLLEQLASRLSSFDSLALTKALVSNHETLLFLREKNKIFHPAQILCFGDTEEKRKEFFDEEARLTDSGLATRALIEYLASTQQTEGKLEAGYDDIETLLAIMYEVVSIGGICDAVHLGVSEHTIEKLPSGRYAICDDNFEDSLGGFATARSVESVNHHIEEFAGKMERLSSSHQNAIVQKDPVVEEIDEAFLADWGLTYSQILQFLYSCYVLAMRRQASVVDISEETLKAEIVAVGPDLTNDVVGKCLERLSLEKRSDYLNPPTGLSGRDIFPWCYNRELSYLRRPIVRWQGGDGTINCVSGFRSCLAAGYQLMDLIHSGRLRNGGKQIEKLLGKFESIKGKEFNEEVRAFLTRFSQLKVWPHDVSIKQNGAIKAEEDYGDIDVLAYDAPRNVLYSIECKNTNTAKNIREMKTEMDEYLGRGDKPEKDRKKALVFKHLRRHEWIVKHIDQVMAYIRVEKRPDVKSMMLTSEVIPTSYLRKEDTPLSILNYPTLRQKGLAYLDTCIEPVIEI